MLDGDGNAASVTCSNGTGSGVLAPGTGIHLNNMLGEEDLNPLGFHMHEPGTRVTSMMAPTIVLRDGEIELALGSAGSNRLRSAILQVIRYVVDDGMDVDGGGAGAAACTTRAASCTRSPGFDAAALDELERRGYRVVRWKGLNLYFGGAQAARRDPEHGRAVRRRAIRAAAARASWSTVDLAETWTPCRSSGAARRSPARPRARSMPSLKSRASSFRRSSSERSSSRPCLTSRSISTLAAISYALSSASAARLRALVGDALEQVGVALARLVARALLDVGRPGPRGTRSCPPG